MKKILIVSNNPISETDNNGKTIASFIRGLPKDNIRQLYFNEEKPTISGFSYFKLSDRDIIKGYFIKKNRGEYFYTDTIIKKQSINEKIKEKFIIKNAFTRILRELLWIGHWKSEKLLNWLEEFRPDIIFFVAGDSIFAYDIVKYIHNKYRTRLITYITDDYIVPRQKENIISKVRRLWIRKKMSACITASDEYLTISSLMQKEYFNIFGKESHLMMNISLPLYDCTEKKSLGEETNIKIVYTGSLYYNRDLTLGLVADAALYYNNKRKKGEPKVIIEVFSNSIPDYKTRKKFERKGCCKFCGSLDANELRKTLNLADVLLFVESFDPAMQEKTKYSLSTKVPEYMSLGKPIFAVGPKNIGSMDYLEDVAFCVHTEKEILKMLIQMISSSENMAKRGMLCLGKYKKYNDVEDQKEIFMKICALKDSEEEL